MEEKAYILKGFQELSSVQQKMLMQARMAMQKARNFVLQRYKVGATALLEGGEMRSAFNNERRVVQGMRCAEDNLLGDLDDEGLGDQLVAIAIVSQSENLEDTEPIPPCGTCRTIIQEYAERSGRYGDLEILYVNANFEEEGVRVSTIGKLYPEPFSPHQK